MWDGGTVGIYPLEMLGGCDFTAGKGELGLQSSKHLLNSALDIPRLLGLLNPAVCPGLKLLEQVKG